MSRIFEALQQSGVDLISLVEHQASAPPSATLTGYQSCERTTRFSLPVGGHTRLVACRTDQDLGAERLRILATRLTALQQSSRFKKLLITSSMRDEGKSLMSANVSITLAKQSQRVLLIDCDLRRPALEAVLAQRHEQGLCDWDGAESVWKYLRKENKLPLWFLSAGTIPADPLQILQSKRLPELFSQISEHFDWIIIDSPPHSAFADSRVLATLVEKVALIARQGKTPKKLLQRCVESLEASKLLGIILNEASIIENAYYHRYYSVSDDHKSAGKSSNSRK